MKIKVNKHKLNIHYRGSPWGSRTQQHAYCLRYAHSHHIESHLGKRQPQAKIAIAFLFGQLHFNDVTSHALFYGGHLVMRSKRCAVQNQGNHLKPQYPHTNSPNWSLYISLKNELREFDNRSRHFLLCDHFINSHNLSLDSVWILFGEIWSWSLLGLKGLTTIKIHSLAEPSYNLISFLNEEFDYFIFLLLSYLPHTCRQSILHDHAAGIVQFQDPGQQWLDLLSVIPDPWDLMAWYHLNGGIIIKN